MKTITLAEKLGVAPYDSPLLEKVRRFGPDTPEILEGLGIARGCWHYRTAEFAPPMAVSESDFTNEELAVALLSPSLPYSPRTIRIGAAMLGATGNVIEVISRLAVAERCVAQIRYIAEAARKFEPNNLFWRQLLNALPASPPVEDGVMPHPSRFVSMTGMTRAGMHPVTVWIRPRPDLSLAHG